MINSVPTGNLDSQNQVSVGHQIQLRSLNLVTRSMRVSPTEQRIDGSDLNLLTQHWLCEPSFFAEAREKLIPQYFLPNEVVISCIWQAMWSIYPRPFTPQGLVSTIQEQIQSNPSIMLTQEQFAALFGPQSILVSWLNIPRQHLDLERAKIILRRFLRQRGIIMPLLRHLQGSSLSQVPTDTEDFLEHAIETSQAIDSSFLPPAQSFGDVWEEHEASLEMTRGNRLVGLETGHSQLDEKLLGLRGLTLLGAMPSVGKTALCLSLAIGVCRAHVVNDAVAVIFSLEMTRDELITRLKCILSELDWRTYTLGSPSLRNGAENNFTPEHEEKIQEGRRRMVEHQIDQRLCILDRSHVGDELTVASILRHVNNFRTRVGARRALIVFDYLQLLATGSTGQSDLEADKQRIRLLQDVVAHTKTNTNPMGDSVIGISEARKPAGAAETKRKNAWGQGLAELMGSARLGYAADAVLLYRRMNEDDIKQHYRIEGRERIERHYENLERNGISPVVLTVEKGRDGTTRGEIPMEFNYRCLKFAELTFTQPNLAPRPTIQPSIEPASSSQQNGNNHEMQSDEDRTPVT